MSSRPTLVFVCDQPEPYAQFIAEFRSADFQLLLARNVSQAKSLLLTRRVDGVVLRHDSAADDRRLATRLKIISPSVPVFVVTDQPQSAELADIDAVWRGEFTDQVVARGMAIFFRQYMTLHLAGRGQWVLRPGVVPFSRMQAPIR